jgi:hypothetical protein
MTADNRLLPIEAHCHLHGSVKITLNSYTMKHGVMSLTAQKQETEVDIPAMRRSLAAGTITVTKKRS